LHAQLRAALTTAIRGRDRDAVAALRSALGALENAEAVDSAPAEDTTSGDANFAGSRVGLRAAEADRRPLSNAQMQEIDWREVADRVTAAVEYDRAGHRECADRLRREAAVLTQQLADADS
jgi:uncharacterized protein YqeY